MKFFIILFLFAIAIACKHETKQEKIVTHNQDSISYYAKRYSEDSLYYSRRDSFIYYAYYRNNLPNKIDKITYNITFAPSVFMRFVFVYSNMYINNDTLIANIQKISNKKDFRNGKIVNKLSSFFEDKNVYYFYSPISFKLYNPRLAQILTNKDKVKKWSVVLGGIDGGSCVIKSTNEQNKVHYCDIYWYKDNDNDAKYLYETLCKEAIGFVYK